MPIFDLTQVLPICVLQSLLFRVFKVLWVLVFKVGQYRLCHDSTVVQHSARNSVIRGSNPTTGTEREKKNEPTKVEHLVGFT